MKQSRTLFRFNIYTSHRSAPADFVIFPVQSLAPFDKRAISETRSDRTPNSPPSFAAYWANTWKVKPIWNALPCSYFPGYRWPEMMKPKHEYCSLRPFFVLALGTVFTMAASWAGDLDPGQLIFTEAYESSDPPFILIRVEAKGGTPDIRVGGRKFRDSYFVTHPERPRALQQLDPTDGPLDISQAPGGMRTRIKIRHWAGPKWENRSRATDYLILRPDLAAGDNFSSQVLVFEEAVEELDSFFSGRHPNKTPLNPQFCIPEMDPFQKNVFWDSVISKDVALELLSDDRVSKSTGFSTDRSEILTRYGELLRVPTDRSPRSASALDFRIYSNPQGLLFIDVLKQGAAIREWLAPGNSESQYFFGNREHLFETLETGSQGAIYGADDFKWYARFTAEQDLESWWDQHSMSLNIAGRPTSLTRLSQREEQGILNELRTRRLKVTPISRNFRIPRAIARESKDSPQGRIFYWDSAVNGVEPHRFLFGSVGEMSLIDDEDIVEYWHYPDGGTLVMETEAGLSVFLHTPLGNPKIKAPKWFNVPAGEVKPQQSYFRLNADAPLEPLTVIRDPSAKQVQELGLEPIQQGILTPPPSPCAIVLLALD